MLLLLLLILSTKLIILLLLGSEETTRCRNCTNELGFSPLFLISYLLDDP